MTTAITIPVQDIPEYTGVVNANVKLLGVVGNTDTRLLPFDAFTASFPTLQSDTPTGPYSPGDTNAIVIADKGLFSRTYSGWGVSPRYVANWDDIDSSTRFLLVNKYQTLSEAEKANVWSSISLTTATSTIAGVVRPQTGLEIDANGNLSVVQATGETKGIVWLDNDAQPDNSAASIAYVDTAASNLRTMISTMDFPVATTSTKGVIIASDSIYVDAAGVATVPAATSSIAGIVYKWGPGVGTSNDTCYITYAQGTQLAEAKINEMVPIATSATAGKVKAGPGLEITTDGTLSAVHAIPRSEINITVADNSVLTIEMEGTENTDPDLSSTYGLMGNVLPINSILGIEDTPVDTTKPYVPTITAVQEYVAWAVRGLSSTTILRTLLPVAGNTSGERGAVYGSSTVSVKSDGQMSVRITSVSNINPGLVYLHGDPLTSPANANATAPTIGFVKNYVNYKTATSTSTGTVQVAVYGTETGQAVYTVPTDTKLEQLRSSVIAQLQDIEERGVEVLPIATETTLGGIKVGEYAGWAGDDTKIPLQIDNSHVYLDANTLPTATSGDAAGYSVMKEVDNVYGTYLTVISSSFIDLPAETASSTVSSTLVRFPSSGTTIYRTYNGVHLENSLFAIGADANDGELNECLYVGKKDLTGIGDIADLSLYMRSIPQYDEGNFFYSCLNSYSISFGNTTKATVSIWTQTTENNDEGHIQLSSDDSVLDITSSTISFTDGELNTTRYTWLPNQTRTVLTKEELDTALATLDLSAIMAGSTIYTFPNPVKNAQDIVIPESVKLASEYHVSSTITAFSSSHFTDTGIIDGENVFEYPGEAGTLALLTDVVSIATSTASTMVTNTVASAVADAMSEHFTASGLKDGEYEYTFPQSTGTLALKEDIYDLEVRTFASTAQLSSSINTLTTKVSVLENTPSVVIETDYATATMDYADNAGAYKLIKLDASTTDLLKTKKLKSISMYHASFAGKYADTMLKQPTYLIVGAMNAANNTIACTASATSTYMAPLNADGSMNTKAYTPRWTFKEIRSYNIWNILGNSDDNVACLYLSSMAETPNTTYDANYVTSTGQTRFSAFRLNLNNDPDPVIHYFTAYSPINNETLSSIQCTPFLLFEFYDDTDAAENVFFVGTDANTGDRFLGYKAISSTGQILKYYRSTATMEDMTSTTYPQ